MGESWSATTISKEEVEGKEKGKGKGWGQVENAHGSVKEHHHSTDQEEATAGAEGHPDFYHETRPSVFGPITKQHTSISTAAHKRRFACAATRGGVRRGGQGFGPAWACILWASDSHIEGILANNSLALSAVLLGVRLGWAGWLSGWREKGGGLSLKAYYLWMQQDWYSTKLEVRFQGLWKGVGFARETRVSLGCKLCKLQHLCSSEASTVAPEASRYRGRSALATVALALPTSASFPRTLILIEQYNSSYTSSPGRHDFAHALPRSLPRIALGDYSICYAQKKMPNTRSRCFAIERCAWLVMPDWPVQFLGATRR